MAESNKKKSSSSRTRTKTASPSAPAGKADEKKKTSSAAAPSKRVASRAKTSESAGSKASPKKAAPKKEAKSSVAAPAAKKANAKSAPKAQVRAASSKTSQGKAGPEARTSKSPAQGASLEAESKQRVVKTDGSSAKAGTRRSKTNADDQAELKVSAEQPAGAARSTRGRRKKADGDNSRQSGKALSARVGAEGKPAGVKKTPEKNIVTVVEALDEEPEDTLRHPLSEIIAVTDAQSEGPEETIERDGRIVARDFGILDLHEGVRAALNRVGYSKPTEVQALCLPHTLEGKDVAGFAQTGTGKTAVFLITAGHRILSEQIKSGEKGAPAVLVLVPTRELAAQIETEAASLFQELRINTMAVYGGSADIDKQTKALSKRVDLVVATPGRLFDLHRQGVLRLDSVGLLVCDEADRMLDMGFIDDVEKVLSLVSENSQKMLFSATGSTKVHELAFEYLNEPEYIETSPEQVTPERITQWCYAARAEEKFSVLLSSLREEEPTCAIVFTNTKVVAEWVGYKLAANGIEAEALTGDLPQNRRLTLIKKIKNGELKVLVATDVLSRGLHVTGLSHVYNFDVPDEPESFIHRIGRTARAGEKGTAITLACEDYGYNMGAVEDLLGFSVPVKPIKDSFLQVEDRSDFPFDSTGRVKSSRGHKDSEPTAEVSEVRGEARSEAGSAYRHAPGRHADRRPHEARGERRDARPARDSFEGSREPRPEMGDRPQFGRPERSDRGGADRVSFEREPAANDSTRETMGRPVERRPRRDRDEAFSASPRREQSEPRFEQGPRPAREEEPRLPRDSRSRDSSKFVRRDERAKEVIEAALLAASRERELQRSATMTEDGLADAFVRVPGVEVAKAAAERLGEGLVKTIRRAAPSLGGLLKKLGDLLEPEASVVTETKSPDVRASEPPEERAESRDSQRRDRSHAPRGPEARPRSPLHRMDPEGRPQREDRPPRHSRDSVRSQEFQDDAEPEIVLDPSGRPARDEREDGYRASGGRDGRRPSRYQNDNRSRGPRDRGPRSSHSDGRRRHT